MLVAFTAAAVIYKLTAATSSWSSSVALKGALLKSLLAFGTIRLLQLRRSFSTQRMMIGHTVLCVSKTDPKCFRWELFQMDMRDLRLNVTATQQQ